MGIRISRLPIAVAILLGLAGSNYAKQGPSDGLEQESTSDPYQLNFESIVASSANTDVEHWKHEADVSKFDAGNAESGATDEINEMSSAVNTARALAFVRQRLAAQPSDYAMLAVLADLLLHKAKTEDDLPSYSLATEAARKSVELNAGYLPAQITLAHCLMASHQFREALSIVEPIASGRGAHPKLMATLFDCQLELGNYDLATETLTALMKLERSAPVLARAARLAELRGDRPTGIGNIDEAIKACEKNGSSPSATAWYYWRRGSMLLDMGKLDEALASFKVALTYMPDDEPSRLGCALVYFAQDKLDSAIEDLQCAAKSEAPPTLALLGDAFALAGNHEMAEQLWQQTEQLMREEAKVAQQAHAREVAVFFADHDRNLEEALDLSTADLELRPDPFSWDVHAWVLYKNKRLNEAATAIRRAIEAVPSDPRILFHAAVIEDASGNELEAANHMRQLGLLNPRFSLTYQTDYEDLQHRLSHSHPK